jgi:F0F1-type ATP synthase assembly protein I
MPPVDENEINGTPGGWRRDIAPYLTMGMELAIAVVGMFFLGRWADGQWGTEPWGMFVGLGVGVTGGFIRFFRRAVELGNRSTAEDKERNAH